MVGEAIYRGAKKAILIITYADYPGFSGLSRRLDGLIWGLKQRGFQIIVVAPIFRSIINVENKSTLDVHLKRLNLRKLWDLFEESLLSKLLLALLLNIFAIAIAFAYRRYISVIQCEHQPTFPAGFVASLLIGKPLICDEMNLLYIRHEGFLRTVLKFVEVFMFKRSALLIASNRRTYEFAKCLSVKTILVPNGIFPPKFKPNWDKRIKAKKVVFTGSLSFSHNLIAIKKLIQIIEELLSELPNLIILVIGGPITKYVKGLMRAKAVRRGAIKFLGFVSEEKLRKIYANSLIGLLPFFEDTPRYGGAEMKALDYFAYRLIVISGPEGIKGIDGIIPGDHFLLAQNLKELKELLKSCFMNPASYIHIAERGAKHVMNRYSWTVVAPKYAKAVESLTVG